jgi:hypothetical protein
VPLNCGLFSVQQEYSDNIFFENNKPRKIQDNLYHDMFGNLSDGRNEQESLQQGGEIAYSSVH